MNSVSMIKPQIQQPQAVKQPQQLAFRGDSKVDEYIDLGKEAIDKVTTTPDETSIKAAIVAIGTFLGYMVTKNISKIKVAIDKSKQSPNKFVKIVGAAAGAILSLLAVVSGSSLLKEKTGETVKPETNLKDDPAVPEKPVSKPDVESDVVDQAPPEVKDDATEGKKDE